MKGMKRFEFLIKHKDFIKTIEELNFYSFVFERENYRYMISIPKEGGFHLIWMFKEEKNEKYFVSGLNEIKETPLWFQELYEKTEKLFIEREKIRKLFN